MTKLGKQLGKSKKKEVLASSSYARLGQQEKKKNHCKELELHG